MSIFVDKDTRVVVQGITGREGQFHTRRCVACGTKVVAGCTPGKGGQEREGIPGFTTVEEAVEKTDANCSLIFVPPPFAADAIMESADAGASVIVAITEGIPVMDMMVVKNYIHGKQCRLIGPNCPGIITRLRSGRSQVQILPGAPMKIIIRSRNISNADFALYKAIFSSFKVVRKT